LHRVSERVRKVADLPVEDGQLTVGAGKQVRAVVPLRPVEDLVCPVPTLRGTPLPQQDTALQQHRPVHQLLVAQLDRPPFGRDRRLVQGAELGHGAALQLRDRLGQCCPVRAGGNEVNRGCSYRRHCIRLSPARG
jgi:hypothetical protein